MKKIAEKLKKSPLFALSLGAKEISHSNFWEWLINIKIDGIHPFVEIFIPEFYQNKNEFVEVKREEGHRDLTIYFKSNDEKKVVFVENKLKSIPTSEQLKKYVSNWKNKKHKFDYGILTGINKTFDEPNWEFLSYSEIAERINNILKNINLESIESDIISLYSQDISNIHTLIEHQISTDEKKYTYLAPKHLEEIKLGDVYLKYRASELKNYILQEFKKNKDLNTSWGMPKVEASFNNKKPTISVVYRQIINDEELGVIGIQIEGNQFRMICGFNSTRHKYNDENQFFLDMKRFGFLETYNKTVGKIRNKKTRLTKEFGKYKNKTTQGVYIYQYWNLEGDYDFSALYKEIASELRNAKKIIKKGFSYK